MPSQELFFSQESNGKQIEVVKTYDSQFAREAFRDMDEQAKEILAQSLIADGALSSEDMPFADEDLWQGVEDGAREDWESFSYFVVREGSPLAVQPLFVSSDWPTAERFAKFRGASVVGV
jgi:hypothetical protein